MKRWVALVLIAGGLAISDPAGGQESYVDEARRLYKRAVELHNLGRHHEVAPWRNGRSRSS